jgi:hypothetical protein
MQTQAGPRNKQLVRIAAIAIAGFCAAVIAVLLDSAPFSIGGASDNPVPVMLSAIPPQTASPMEAPADRVYESRETPTEPMCAQLAGIGSTEEPEGFGEGSLGVPLAATCSAIWRRTRQPATRAMLRLSLHGT